MSGLDRLRKVAEAARTSGPWELNTDDEFEDEVTVVHGVGVYLVAEPFSPDYAEHIATFDPPTVLALLDVAEAASEANCTVPSGPDGGSHARLDTALARLREVTS